MKLASILAFLLTISLFAGLADAKGNKGSKPIQVMGEITAIDGSNVTIQPRTPKNAANPPATIIVTTTDSTAVTINGEKKDLTGLAVGQKVKASLDTDNKTVLKIDVRVGKKSKNTPTPAAAPTTAPATQPAQ